MLYNKHSFRRLINNPLRYLGMLLNGTLKWYDYKEFERSTYDTNMAGEAAPLTEYFSNAEVKKIMRDFSTVKIKVENFDNINFLFLNIPREYFLKNIAKIGGLDLYVTAIKQFEYFFKMFFCKTKDPGTLFQTMAE